MNIPPNLKVALSVLAAVVVERILVWLRLSYLKKQQKNIALDFSKEVILRQAFWSYLVELCGLLMSAFTLIPFFISRGTAPKCISCAMFVIFFSGTLFLFAARLKERVVIGVGRQLRYENGTIHSDQIVRYSCNGYNFRITKTSGTTSKIPATLKHSQIVMAFLEDAVSKKQIYKKHDS
jgi:hypothetical protein